MSNEAFKAAFAKVLAKAGAKAELVVRKSMLDLQGAMIEASPVDTGRFKSNWQAGIGSINSGVSDTGDALGRTSAVLQGWKPGQTVWLTNSLPYAYRLEYQSWSKQAPQGMVRIAVQNFQSYIQKAASSVK